MEKYREVQWNKEIEIERKRNAGKTQDSIDPQTDNSNFSNPGNKDESIKQGTVNFKSVCRLVALIAIGTILGNFISYLGYKYLAEANANNCPTKNK